MIDQKLTLLVDLERQEEVPPKDVKDILRDTRQLRGKDASEIVSETNLVMPAGLLKLLDYPEFITGKITRELFALHPDDLSWHDGTGILPEDATLLERTNAMLTQGISNNQGTKFEPPRPVWVSVRGFVYDLTCELPPKTPPPSHLRPVLTTLCRISSSHREVWARTHV